VIEYKDETKTLSQWAKELNVEKETLRYHIRVWGIERALTTPNRTMMTNIEFKGVVKSMKGWAEHLNIGVPAFKVRLRQWGICDKTFQVKGITHNNQTKTLAEWSREFNVSIQHRVARGNLPPEKVFTSTKYKTRTSLVGLRFNRLVVVEECGRQCGKVLWLCLCDCGNTKLVQTGNLIQHRVQSCGCLKKYVAAIKKYPHLR
jgi:hypothetical protein